MNFFCINLPRATDRRLYAEAEFSQACIDVTFVSGIDAPQNQLSHAQRWITPGHIGCALSHIMLAEQIRYSDGGLSIIFEDDPVIESGFAETLGQRLATLPADWDVAIIGWHPDQDRYDLLVTDEVNEDWLRLRSGDVWGTYCYALNGRKGAGKLLACITPITSHIDRMFHESARAGKLNSYFLRHQLVWWQRSFPSQTA